MLFAEQIDKDGRFELMTITRRYLLRCTLQVFINTQAPAAKKMLQASNLMNGPRLS